MHEQGSRMPTLSLRARQLGFLHGHIPIPGALKKPGGANAGTGAHGGAFGGLFGGFFDPRKQGGSGNDSPPHSPLPGLPADGGGKPVPDPANPTPPPGKTTRGSGSPATSLAHAGSNPASRSSASRTGLPESSTPTTVTHAPSHSIGSVTRPPSTRSPVESPSASASASPAQSPTVAAPSIGNNQTGGFPLAAAGVLGAVLSFLVVSAIIWCLWYYRRARTRRRANAPEWDFETSTPPAMREVESVFTAASSARSTATIPYFITAHEAGHLDAAKPPSSGAEHDAIPNPFAHSEDEREVDPFDSLRRGNTQMTVSTMSV